MSQKIEGNLPTAATLRTNAVSSKIASAGEDRTAPVAATPATDSVKLTGEATNLQVLQRELSQAPAIDTARVQAVKESLQNGSYTINPDAIANRMIDMNQQLAG
ncbi:flagellar biosynthesis anti-sigma factor FlgM [Xanthomonas maliensis]|uniref:flagellar biosynthesis anti-sigma factor FlgM n=1 Tax=Xanthomonas maliensis TaxID=1321368 RepID=UPI0003A2832C|nr:flagellar biosynthesis anti-sigma factor FlgM [Xanthomonas maliensis]KAB7771852.1 flagellar biosynthesis anti-sigma factor FlgM [Xanthomonas maliensis]